jgi:MiaB-like tRNA modifying enzyme
MQSHGCTANLVESQSMMGLLSEAGFKLVDDPEYAEVNIVNICTVKGNAVPLKEIKDLTAHYPNSKMVVTGCITRDIIRHIREINENVSLVNTHNIHRIVDAVEESLQGNVLEALTQERPLKVSLPKIKTNKVVGIVPIASGCADHCAYCSVKLIKGDIFSYPESHIVKEVEKAVAEGCKEIWLTSQDNGTYGLDKDGRKLHVLLNTILKEVQGDYKVRLGMLNPRHVLPILDDLIQIFQDERMFKFLHIPAESGNNEILGKMHRKYNVHDYKQIVETFRRYVPNITIASDLIVGFPTETELQFQDSLHLLQDVKFDVLNIARYSPRPGTLGARMEGSISSNVKKERSKEVTELFERIAFEQNRKWIGWEGKIILDEKGKDGTLLGRNYAYKQVVLPRAEYKLGDELYVKILYATTYDLRGKVIEKKIEVEDEE